MRAPAIIILFIFVAGIILAFIYNQDTPITTNNYGAPPYIEDAPEQYFFEESAYTNWKRPSGPFRVGLQAGHWKTSEMPEEQARLRDSGGGTSFGQVSEWEVNLSIAQEAKKLLETQGVVVDIIPSTIPPGYIADAFVAIHADGSTSPTKSGFKVAAPRRDMTGKADELVLLLEEEYARITKLDKDPNITRNMTGYYAFSWRRFTHAIHPMTTAAILETGFLTNPDEAQLLIDNPEIPAQALANAVLKYLELHVEQT